MLHSIASFQVCEFPSLFSALDSLLLQSRSGNFSREFLFLIHPPKSPAFDLQRHLNYLTVKFPQWKKKPNSSKCNGDPWGKYADYRVKAGKDLHYIASDPKLNRQASWHFKLTPLKKISLLFGRHNFFPHPLATANKFPHTKLTEHGLDCCYKRLGL